MSRRKRKPRHKGQGPRRGIYILPNLVTSASLFAGFFGMVEAVSGDFTTAAIAILVSAVFDGLDGKVARATGTVSKFGVEYDSLADLVAFGVSPAMIIYQWGLHDLGRLGFLVAFLFMACGALRLARFNVQVDVVGTSHFVGMPIPAAASALATTILFCHQVGYAQLPSPWPLFALSLVLSFLMVSSIHYLSFKELGLGKLKSFNWLVAALLLFVLIAIAPQVMGFVIMAGYVILGPLGAKMMAKSKLKHEAAHAEGLASEDEASAEEEAEATL